MNSCRRSALPLSQLALAGLLCLLAIAPPAPAADAPPGAARWEGRIAQYEQQDKAAPPPQGAVVFVGSSSIAAWDTKKDFPDIVTIQRGFGGSQVADSVHFAGRIVLPYRPRAIVFYAGDNDIADGKPPRQVLADYKAFVAKVHTELPQTRIVFVAIKPSIARWHLVEQVRKANALIEAYTKTDERLFYVDVDAPTLGADGRPRKELLKEDGLHLTHEGYLLWSALVRPYILADAAPPAPPAVDWLTPRIMETWPGGQVTVRVRLADDAEIAWGDLPAGMTAGPWQHAEGTATSTLTCGKYMADGIYEIVARVTAGAATTELRLKLEVGAALTIASEPFVPGQAAKVKLQGRGDEPLTVKLSVPDGGKVEPAELKVDWRGADATFTAADDAKAPIELTAQPDGAAAQTHWLRPARMEIIETGEIELDGAIEDWPQVARIDARSLEAGKGFAPAICVGWTPAGLWLAVKVSAGEPKPADPDKWWASSNVEVFVDTSGRAGEKWTADTSRQYYFLPIREGQLWRATAGQYFRDDAKGSSIYPHEQCKTAIRAGDDGWTIEAFIPAEALGAAPKAGDTWRLLVSVNSVQAGGDSSTAAWPQIKPKDVAASKTWGEVRFAAQVPKDPSTQIPK